MPARRSLVRIAKSKSAKSKSSKKSKAAALPSASLPQSALAEVGSRFSVAALVKLTNVVLGKVQKQSSFATYGFDAGWIAAMTAQRQEIEAASSAVGAARAAVLPTSKALTDAIAAAKDWRRRAATVLALTPGAAARYVATGSSPKKLAAVIDELIPRVGAKETVACGGGPALANEGKALLATLSSTFQSHVATSGEVSPEIRALNAIKGVLYEELQRLARAARLVAPKEASLYAPSRHLRTRMKSRAKKKKPAAAPATPTAAMG